MLRLRQLVLAAHELEPAVGRLRELLGAGIAYQDSGVGAFGLTNAVLTAGRDVVEVISPVSRTAAAARWLERRGAEGGYMLMVDGPPALVEPGRIATLGVRVVHELRLPDITDVHLHPKDVGGVLLAVDTVDPPGSWRWAGPDWTGAAPSARGGLRSVTIAVDDPSAVARRWAELLDLPQPAEPLLTVDEGRQELRFVAADAGLVGAVAATFALPVPTVRSATVAGVALDVVPYEEHA
jgi:hypothetical protein